MNYAILAILRGLAGTDSRRSASAKSVNNKTHTSIRTSKQAALIAALFFVLLLVCWGDVRADLYTSQPLAPVPTARLQARAGELGGMALAEFTLRAVASVIALVGAFLAVMKYLNEKKKANETAKIESQKPFSAKQQEIYFDLVATTALISNGNAEDLEHAKAREHFWILFWGPLPMVATESVAAAADAFSEALDDPTNGVALRNASMNLARACRRSLGKAWDVYIDTFDVSQASTAKRR